MTSYRQVKLVGLLYCFIAAILVAITFFAELLVNEFAWTPVTIILALFGAWVCDRAVDRMWDRR